MWSPAVTISIIAWLALLSNRMRSSAADIRSSSVAIALFNESTERTKAAIAGISRDLLESRLFNFEGSIYFTKAPRERSFMTRRVCQRCDER